MAVPATGQVTMRGIRREIGNNNYNASTTYINISLEDMSEGVNGTINTNSGSRPNGTNPHEMSEFRGYDHDAAGSASAPSVSTTSATWDSTNSELDMYGNVTSNGGATLTQKGFVGSTTSNPTTSNNAFQTSTANSSTGSYTLSVAGNSILTGPNGTYYYVRAYAINSQGTSYGSNIYVFVPNTMGGFP